MSDQDIQELRQLSQKLVDAIDRLDWDTYASLCDESLTSFEPEANGQLIHGLGFHKYYFELPRGSSPRQSTLCSLHVRVMTNIAVVSAVRLVQKIDPTAGPTTVAGNETRVWQKIDGAWKHVHFHRSGY